MNLDELRARVDAARTFEHAIDGRTFRLRLPDEHVMRRATAEQGVADLQARIALAAGPIVQRALVGWAGVTVADVLPGADEGGEALPFTPEAVALVVAERVDWVDALFVQIMARTTQRREQLEAARGNSARASSTT